MIESHNPAKDSAVTMKNALIKPNGTRPKRAGRRARSSENRIASAPYVPIDTIAMYRGKNALNRPPIT
jgi:hypothetical protein